MTWYKARDWCTERGMQLATLKTLNQLEAVAKELTSRVLSKKRARKRFEIKISTFHSVAANNNFWVSASDIGRTPHGQFQWLDGTPVDKASWASGDPNDAKEGKETCVYLYTGDAKLRDESCSDTNRILCEIPAALSSRF
jgi:Lectin C-type domain